MPQGRSLLDIPLFYQIYKLYKVLHSYQGSIPKSQRYTLWQRCENTALALLELLISTSHCQGVERLRLLHAMSHKLDLLKVLIRLAQETRAITPKQYTAVQGILQEVGQMIGGWIKSVAH
ncbi:MAG: four helix bundle protein [Bacteroidota bacterium]